MNKNIVKFFLGGLLVLLTISESYACYPGLDCPEDLPAKKATTKPGWSMQDRYMVDGGLVQDPTTGLMWMRCSFGQTWNKTTCTGKVVEVTWEQAMNIPKHFDYAGYRDWRLPTLEELKNLIFCSSGQMVVTDKGTNGCADDYMQPTIEQEAFPETSTVGYWTSSAITGMDGYAWLVYFSYGYTGSDGKDNTYAVRLVRGKP